MNTISVCCGTGCSANGSLLLAEESRKKLTETGAPAKVECSVKKTGCKGLCEDVPVVTILPAGTANFHVKPSDVEEILSASILKDEVVERLLYKDADGTKSRTLKENPFYAPQVKIALRNTGNIDPTSLDEYIAAGGYEALKKALSMTPEEILCEMDDSGLRGRGGAGFPTAVKWRTAAGYDNFPKYVACNGDEGDPGAFMDGSVMDGDPHSVLEGMAVCALAIGAEQGFLYIRDEYIVAVRHIRQAIRDAEAAGILGDNMMGSGKRLKLEVVRGGGAFVCGESTALMTSIEGHVGEPRAKYIRSVQRGLWGQPTVLNNVETLACVPYIILHGGKHFASVGTEGSKGTKVFALVGKVRRTGLVEVPMGATLRQMIFEIGGGIKDGRKFKAVQTGGPSGGCIPESMLDLPVDFDTLKKYGAMMGSGGMIVMDDRSCMVEVARYYISFLCGESCGKCTPCREGLRQMLQILTDICEGRGTMEDLDLLEELGEMMQDAALCALGTSAPNPVLTTLRYFRDEYEAHILEHRCPAGVCKELTRFAIDPGKCRSCGACMRACPAGAITGRPKSPYTINTEACIRCGSCREACRFDSVFTLGKEDLA